VSQAPTWPSVRARRSPGASRASVETLLAPGEHPLPDAAALEGLRRLRAALAAAEEGVRPGAGYHPAVARRTVPSRRRAAPPRALWTVARGGGRRRRSRSRGLVLPPAGWVLIALLSLAVTDVAYQVLRKPTELLALVPSTTKTPAATWDAYGSLFREYSTPVIRPELLAALVQAESAGDPLARTYWRWRWRWNPLELWAPASSAVGILQITDGTFQVARRLCIHDHQVAREGPWHDLSSCWFNALYFRALPGDAIEMTSAYLDVSVAETLGAPRRGAATPGEKERLAAVVHLCGRERGLAFAARGFRALPGERCGDHDLARYLARIEELAAVFARLAAG